MMPLMTYPVFDWLLNDSREAIEARAELSGGTLVEVMKVADVEAMVKAVRQSEIDGLNIRQYLEACDAILDRLKEAYHDAALTRYKKGMP